MSETAVPAEARSKRHRRLRWHLALGLIVATPVAALTGGVFLYGDRAIASTYHVRPSSLWVGAMPALIIWAGGLAVGAAAWFVRNRGRRV